MNQTPMTDKPEEKPSFWYRVWNHPWVENLVACLTYAVAPALGYFLLEYPTWILPLALPGVATFISIALAIEHEDKVASGWTVFVAFVREATARQSRVRTRIHVLATVLAMVSSVFMITIPYSAMWFWMLVFAATTFGCALVAESHTLNRGDRQESINTVIVISIFAFIVYVVVPRAFMAQPPEEYANDLREALIFFFRVFHL